MAKESHVMMINTCTPAVLVPVAPVDLLEISKEDSESDFWGNRGFNSSTPFSI